MLTILIFIILLGILVFVHELGHFITARRNDIKVDEFGFGFPPRMGGFVKIKGEDGSGENDPESFAGKPAWVRIKVLAAGVIMNFLLAWALISIVFLLGLPQPIAESERGRYPDARVQIVEIKQDSPAKAMGLQPGDIILSLNDTPVKALSEVGD